MHKLRRVPLRVFRQGKLSQNVQVTEFNESQECEILMIYNRYSTFVSDENVYSNLSGATHCGEIELRIENEVLEAIL